MHSRPTIAAGASSPGLGPAVFLTPRPRTGLWFLRTSSLTVVSTSPVGVRPNLHIRRFTEREPHSCHFARQRELEGVRAIQPLPTAADAEPPPLQQAAPGHRHAPRAGCGEVPVCPQNAGPESPRKFLCQCDSAGTERPQNAPSDSCSVSLNIVLRAELLLSFPP